MDSAVTVDGNFWVGISYFIPSPIRMDSNNYCFFKIVVPCTSLASSSSALQWQPRVSVCVCARACAPTSTVNEDVLCTSLPQPWKDAEAACDVIQGGGLRAPRKYRPKRLRNWFSEKDSREEMPSVSLEEHLVLSRTEGTLLGREDGMSE